MKLAIDRSSLIAGVIGAVSVTGIATQAVLFNSMTTFEIPRAPPLADSSPARPPIPNGPTTPARAFNLPPVKSAPIPPPPVITEPARGFPSDIRLMGVIMDSDGKLEVAILEQAGRVHRLAGGQMIADWRLSEIGPREAVFTKDNSRHRLELLWDNRSISAPDPRVGHPPRPPLPPGPPPAPSMPIFPRP